MSDVAVLLYLVTLPLLASYCVRVCFLVHFFRDSGATGVNFQTGEGVSVSLRLCVSVSLCVSVCFCVSLCVSVSLRLCVSVCWCVYVRLSTSLSLSPLSAPGP